MDDPVDSAVDSAVDSTAADRADGRAEGAGAASGPPSGHDPREVRRVALSSFLGNSIEFYDFLLYGTASAIVFNRLFFSDLSPLLGTIAAFATLAAGYVARPLGGVLFGHFGDRIGRKRVLVVTMTTMGTASGLIGVLPTYGQVGAVAPVLLLVLRLVQGLAVGGEWGGAGLMTAEHADRRRRGLLSSIPQMGLPAGGLLATVAVALVTLLPPADLLSWGWRVPFLASFALLAVGLFVRLRISESPLFLARLRAGESLPSVPFVALLRRHPLNLLRGILAGIGALAIQGIFGVFLISYAVGIGYPQPTVLAAQTAGSALGIVSIPLWAALSDRIGRKPVFLGGAIAAAAFAFPAFALVNTGSVALLFVAQIIMFGVIITAMNALMVALLSELFPTEVRYTGVSFSYQAATTIGGGFGPLIGAALLAAAGGGTQSTPVSVFLLVAAVLSGLAVWSIPETRGADLSGGSRSGTAAAPTAQPA